MSRTLRAELLRAQNQPREALAALGVAAVPPDNVLPFILSYPLAHERWLRAELLHQLKQDDEALLLVRHVSGSVAV